MQLECYADFISINKNGYNGTKEAAQHFGNICICVSMATGIKVA